MRESCETGHDLHNAINGVAGVDCVISLGANVSGRWGTPTATLCRSLHVLQQNKVSIIARSRIYRTPPHPGAGLMPEFYNLTIMTRTNHSIGGLLRLFKIIERMAGRQVRSRWSARPLDLDLIDYGGRVINWPMLNRLGGPLVLPHPLMHLRGFVLVPLAEIAPHWRHPVLGLAAGALLRRHPGLRRGIAPA
jgi:2-amino-4-hydroxy-6-hydroxymethyldihydropteridine diphosphokinase